MSTVINLRAAPGIQGITELPPDQISDLEVWYKGDLDTFSDGACSVPSVNNGNVDCWGDQSGNNKDLIAPAAPLLRTSFINGISVLDFDGSNDNMVLPPDANMNFENNS